MGILKDAIVEIKEIRDDKVEYCDELLKKLKDTKSEVLSKIYNPNENIIDLLSTFRKLNYYFEGMYSYYVGYDDENEKNTHLEADDIRKYKINIDKEKLVENLTGKKLELKTLNTIYIVKDFTIYEKYGESDKYIGKVAFKAYCDSTIDENHAYSIDEINDLIKQGKMFMYSSLKIDKNNLCYREGNSDKVNNLNLKKIQYPLKEKNKIVFIKENELDYFNNNIQNSGVNLSSILYYTKRVDSFMDKKDILEEEEAAEEIQEAFSNFHKYYPGIESALCSQIILEISKAIKEVENDKQTAIQQCKDRIKFLVLQTKQDLENIEEIEK